MPRLTPIGDRFTSELAEEISAFLYKRGPEGVDELFCLPTAIKIMAMIQEAMDKEAAQENVAIRIIDEYRRTQTPTLETDSALAEVRARIYKATP